MAKLIEGTVQTSLYLCKWNDGKWRCVYASNIDRKGGIYPMACCYCKKLEEWMLLGKTICRHYEQLLP